MTYNDTNTDTVDQDGEWVYRSNFGWVFRSREITDALSA